MAERLKLFVWEDALSDYTDGIMFAFAPDVETARELIIEKGVDSEEPDLLSEPRIIEQQEGFVIYGGG